MKKKQYAGNEQVCPLCGNNDVKFETVVTTERASIVGSFLYFITFTWIFRAIRGRKEIQTTKALCQKCGNTWIVHKPKFKLPNWVIKGALIAFGIIFILACINAYILN